MRKRKTAPTVVTPESAAKFGHLGGRPPTRITDELIAQFAQRIRSVTASLEDIAESLGVNARMFFKWLQVARIGSSEKSWTPQHAKLELEVRKAQAERNIRLTALVERAAQGVKGDEKWTVKPEWRAAARLLAVADPDRWADRLVVQGAKDGAPVAVQVYRAGEDPPEKGDASVLLPEEDL